MDGNENETQDATAGSAPAKQSGGDAPSATAPQNDAGTVTAESTDSKAEDGETTTPPAKPRRRKRHTQPKADMDLLSDYQIMIEGLELAGEDLAPLLPAYGLTPEVVARHREDHTAALGAIDARQMAIAAQRYAADEQRTRYDAMVSTMGIFRQLSRAVLNTAGRVALALDEPLPSALGQFLLVARHSLTVAQAEPYASLLATTTFGPARLAAALTELDELEETFYRRQQVDHDAKMATRARNNAMRAVRRSIRALRIELRALRRTHPKVVGVPK